MVERVARTAPKAGGSLPRPIARRGRAIAKKATAGGSYFAAPKTNIKFIRTGSRMLDLALGGGWAMRRTSNIVGDFSAGKTLLCIEACANFAEAYPKGKGNIRYREIEEAFDEPYAGAIGMPLERVDFGGDKRISTVEELYDDLEKVVKKARVPELYIVDSLDAISNAEELDGDFGGGYQGAKKARGMSEIFRRLNGESSRSNVTLIVVSQLRDNIGVTYGAKSKRSGGRALDFYSSQVVWLRKMAQIVRTVRNIKRAIGIDIGAQVKKNKVSMPFREAEFPLMFGYGIDDYASCLKWLKTIKADNLFYRNTKPEVWKQLMATCDADRYREEMATLHEIVDEQWYALESEFLPTRRKYGG